MPEPQPRIAQHHRDQTVVHGRDIGRKFIDGVADCAHRGQDPAHDRRKTMDPLSATASTHGFRGLPRSRRPSASKPLCRDAVPLME